MDASTITPGLLSFSAASTLKEAVQLAADNRRRLDLLADDPFDDFPARIIGTDSQSGSGSPSWSAQWQEEAFDENGRRYLKINGRSGDSNYSPAWPVGEGAEPTEFPVEVWLRRRNSTTDKGPVYEFDWQGSGGAGDTEMTRVTTTADDEGLLTAYITEFGPGNTDTADGEEILMLLL